MKIKIHIERLILDGLPISHSQRPIVQAALEAELAGLLAADGIAPELQAGGALPRVPGGSIELTSDDNPGQLGRQIAQAVYGGIGGSAK
jgi:hypothetical protein